MSPVPDFFYLKVMLGSVECFLELDDLLRHLVLGPGLPDRSGLARDRQLLSVCLDCLSHLNIVSHTLGPGPPLLYLDGFVQLLRHLFKRTFYGGFCRGTDYE